MRTETVPVALVPLRAIVAEVPNVAPSVATSKLAGAVMVISAVRFEPETLKVCAADAVPCGVVKELRLPVIVNWGTGFAAGVTEAHDVPTRISSMSAFGVAAEFRIHIDENVVTVDVPEVLEIPPLGSLPPNDDGFTHIVEISGEAPLKSCLTTTR